VIDDAGWKTQRKKGKGAAAKTILRLGKTDEAKACGVNVVGVESGKQK